MDNALKCINSIQLERNIRKSWDSPQKLWFFWVRDGISSSFLVHSWASAFKKPLFWQRNANKWIPLEKKEFISDSPSLISFFVQHSIAGMRRPCLGPCWNAIQFRSQTSSEMSYLSPYLIITEIVHEYFKANETQN